MIGARFIGAWIGNAFHLPDDLPRQWPELRSVRYRRGGLPTRLGGWLLGLPEVAGVALGRTVWLAPGASLDPELLLHEVRHVQQWRTVPGFAWRYLWESVRRGYANNRFEVDARDYAAARMRGAPARPQCFAAAPQSRTSRASRPHPNRYDR